MSICGTFYMQFTIASRILIILLSSSFVVRKFFLNWYKSSNRKCYNGPGIRIRAGEEHMDSQTRPSLSRLLRYPYTCYVPYVDLVSFQLIRLEISPQFAISPGAYPLLSKSSLER